MKLKIKLKWISDKRTIRFITSGAWEYKSGRYWMGLGMNEFVLVEPYCDNMAKMISVVKYGKRKPIKIEMEKVLEDELLYNFEIDKLKSLSDWEDVIKEIVEYIVLSKFREGCG